MKRAELGSILRNKLALLRWRIAIVVVLSMLGLVLLAYLLGGKSAGGFLAGAIVSTFLALFIGLLWPSFTQMVIRASPSVRVQEYLEFAGVRFPFRVLDGPTSYQHNDLVLQLRGDLELPEDLDAARRHMIARMETYEGDRVLFNGQCYMLAQPIRIRRRWEDHRERPTIAADFLKSEYFVRVLCREALGDDVKQHIEIDWPALVPRVGELRRSLLTQSTGFSPFLHPGAGINLCLVAYDRQGRPWTVVQKRGTGIAENTGAWASSLHESFSPDDMIDGFRIDPYRTAARAAREELGIELTNVEFFIVGMDEGSLPGTRVMRSGGFELIGMAETSLPAEHLADMRFFGRDKFEIMELLAMELNIAQVSDLLKETSVENWFPPALVALVETLNRLHPGSWGMVSERVADHTTQKRTPRTQRL